MFVSRQSRLISLAIGVGIVPVALALTIPALPGATASSSHDAAALDTPQQVADTLDSVVQPRFQQNAGQFGVDRVVFPGHDNIYGLTTVTPTEKRRLRRINAAHRPYVIAFLHCAHKPGEDVGDKTQKAEPPVKSSVNNFANKHPSLEGKGPQTDPPVKPFVETLATATSTEAGSERLMEWGDKNLDKVVLPALPVLTQGIGVDRDFGNWQVVMRPVRASKSSCLNCHAGASRGDTLGVMIYAVDKNPIRAEIKSFQEGDE